MASIAGGDLPELIFGKTQIGAVQRRGVTNIGFHILGDAIVISEQNLSSCSEKESAVQTA